MSETRVCSKCNKEKSVDKFHKNVKKNPNFNQFHSWCRDCYNTTKQNRASNGVCRD